MKSVLALALMASAVVAQYDGQIKAKDNECPQFVAGDKSLPLSYNPGSNICADITEICPDGKCFLSMQAVGTGVETKMPEKMGACPGSDCSADCQSWDIESQGSSISVECAEFTGQHYFYLGF